MLPVLLPLALLMPLVVLLPELQQEALLELLTNRPPRTVAAGTDADTSAAVSPVEGASEEGVPTLLSTVVPGKESLLYSEKREADGSAVRDAFDHARAVLILRLSAGEGLSKSSPPLQGVSWR